MKCKLKKRKTIKKQVKSQIYNPVSNEVTVRNVFRVIRRRSIGQHKMTQESLNNDNDNDFENVISKSKFGLL